MASAATDPREADISQASSDTDELAQWQREIHTEPGESAESAEPASSEDPEQQRERMTTRFYRGLHFYDVDFPEEAYSLFSKATEEELNAWYGKVPMFSRGAVSMSDQLQLYQSGDVSAAAAEKLQKAQDLQDILCGLGDKPEFTDATGRRYANMFLALVHHYFLKFNEFLLALKGKPNAAGQTLADLPADFREYFRDHEVQDNPFVSFSSALGPALKQAVGTVNPAHRMGAREFGRVGLLVVIDIENEDLKQLKASWKALSKDDYTSEELALHNQVPKDETIFCAYVPAKYVTGCVPVKIPDPDKEGEPFHGNEGRNWKSQWDKWRQLPRTKYIRSLFGAPKDGAQAYKGSKYSVEYYQRLVNDKFGKSPLDEHRDAGRDEDQLDEFGNLHL